jgi:EAL domain-containing protein (putative c-di-GMP-specific phosphodiesterase class I)
MGLFGFSTNESVSWRINAACSHRRGRHLLVRRLLAELTADADDPVGRVIELARRHLGMDVVYVAEFRGGKQVHRALGGDAQSFDLILGDGPDLATTYCNLMTRGEIPNVINDSQLDPRVRDLATTVENGVGSYIGVPLVLPDGDIYGSFCCLNHGPTDELGDRDVKFMQMLAELLVDHLAAERTLESDRDQVQAIIDSTSFLTALQPIVRISDRRCIGFEALSRFSSGAAPDAVFAAAERTGLGVDLEVATAARAIEVLPMLGDNHYLSLNASPALILTQARSASAADLPWHRIVGELTEREDVDDYSLLRRQLEPLRDLGMRVAIDDAGAGYASLHHIAQLHPDVIKIDRTLIDGVAEDPARRSIVTGFCALARDLDASLVAEGVERETDLAVLADLGVDAAQGYLLGRPTTDHPTLLAQHAFN